MHYFPLLSMHAQVSVISLTQDLACFDVVGACRFRCIWRGKCFGFSMVYARSSLREFFGIRLGKPRVVVCALSLTVVCAVQSLPWTNGLHIPCVGMISYVFSAV